MAEEGKGRMLFKKLIALSEQVRSKLDGDEVVFPLNEFRGYIIKGGEKIAVLELTDEGNIMIKVDKVLDETKDTLIRS